MRNTRYYEKLFEFSAHQAPTESQEAKTWLEDTHAHISCRAPIKQDSRAWEADNYDNVGNSQRYHSAPVINGL